MYTMLDLHYCLTLYRNNRDYVECVGPLTSFLDADKDTSSTLKYSGRTSPSPRGRHYLSGSQNIDRGGVKFTEYELKVLR